MSSSSKDGLNQSKHAPAGGVGEVVRVAWPIVIAMLSYTAMDVADTLFVGWVGKTELAAVGLATMAIFLLNSLFMGTLHGTKVVSSQATGADKPHEAIMSGWTGAALAVPFGLLVAALSLLGGAIFAVMGGPAPVQALAGDYFGIRALGAVFLYVMVAFCDYFQGTGDTRTPMKINLVANAANIALDPLLIFGLGPIPAMGVSGAALATIIAQSLGMLLAAIWFVSRVGPPRKPALKLVKKVMSLGFPMGVRAMVGIGAFTVFTAFLARMGEDQLAAHQIVIKIMSISFLPGWGLSETATILTGQYVGARRFEAAQRAFRSSLIVAMALMGTCALAFFLLGEHLVGLFNSDPAVIELGTTLLLVAAGLQLFDAVAMVATGALNGVGDTKFTMWTGVVCSWLVLVPAAYLFGVVLEGGAVGAWLGLTLEIVVVAAITLWRFVRNGWR
jgi:multidrug resistance protein, MATE family